MKRPSVAFAVWGAFLLGLGAVMWFVFFADALSFLLPAFAAGGTFALALAAIRGDSKRDGVERVTELSLGAPLAAIGFSAALIGLELGEWLILIGAGMFGLALGVLVRERAR